MDKCGALKINLKKYEYFIITEFTTFSIKV